MHTKRAAPTQFRSLLPIDLVYRFSYVDTQRDLMLLWLLPSLLAKSTTDRSGYPPAHWGTTQRYSGITPERACSKELVPVPWSQLRQPKRRMSDWAFCGEGSCARAAWSGRRFGSGGFCTICVRASCTGSSGRVGACAPSSTAQA
jgi:hypothetical protein